MPAATRQLSYERTTALVARALGLTAAELEAALIPARAEHLAQVVELRKQALDSPITWDDPRYLAWRYRFGSSTQGRGDCWIVLRGTQVLGMMGAEDVQFLLGSESIPTFSSMDIAVHGDCEGTGLGVWIVQALARRVRCGITIGSNPSSRHMIVSLLTRLPDRRSYLHGLDFQQFYARRVPLKLFAAALAMAANATMRLWRRLLPGGGSSRFQIRELTRFDAAVDDLAQRARRPQEVTIQRDAQWLNWRLFTNPRARYRVWGAFEGGRLVGFMATQQLRAHNGHDMLTIVGWMIDLQHERAVFQTLLSQALREAIQVRAEFVQVTAYHEPSERLLRRCGFFRQRNEYETVALFGSDTATIERLRGSPHWYLGEAHTDRDGL